MITVAGTRLERVVSLDALPPSLALLNPPAFLSQSIPALVRPVSRFLHAFLVKQLGKHAFPPLVVFEKLMLLAFSEREE